MDGPFDTSFGILIMGGSQRDVIVESIFWNSALISKIRSHFSYFEVRKRFLHHRFEDLKPPLWVGGLKFGKNGNLIV